MPWFTREVKVVSGKSSRGRLRETTRNLLDRVKTRRLGSLTSSAIFWTLHSLNTRQQGRTYPIRLSFSLDNIRHLDIPRVSREEEHIPSIPRHGRQIKDTRPSGKRRIGRQDCCAMSRIVVIGVAAQPTFR